MSDNSESPQGTQSGALSFAEALKLLPTRQQVFVQAYLLTLNKSAAAREAKLGKTPESQKVAGYQTYKIPEVRAAIEAGFKEAGMGPEETLARIDELAAGGLAELYTEVEYEEAVYGNVPGALVLLELEAEQAKYETLQDKLKTLDEKRSKHYGQLADQVQVQIIELQTELEFNPQHTIRRQVGKVKKTRLEFDLLKARELGKLHLVQKLTYNTHGIPQVQLESKLKALELRARAHSLLTDNTNHSGDISLHVTREEVGGPLD